MKTSRGQVKKECSLEANRGAFTKEGSLKKKKKAGRKKKPLKRLTWADEVGGVLVKVLRGQADDEVTLAAPGKDSPRQKKNVFNKGRHSGSLLVSVGGSRSEGLCTGEGVGRVEPRRGREGEGCQEHLRMNATLSVKEATWKKNTSAKRPAWVDEVGGDLLKGLKGHDGSEVALHASGKGSPREKTEVFNDGHLLGSSRALLGDYRSGGSSRVEGGALTAPRLKEGLIRRW